MSCTVCEHEKRTEIENALMNISSDAGAVTLKAISDAYEVTEDDLKLHALLHSPVGVNGEETDSISRKLKLKEADILSAVVAEYMVTLKTVGRRINKLAQEDNEIMFEKLLTKAVADLYIGLGGEIRASIKAMAEMNQLLNGPDNGAAGLQALSNAIRGIVKKDDND